MGSRVFGRWSPGLTSQAVEWHAFLLFGVLGSYDTIHIYIYICSYIFIDIYIDMTIKPKKYILYPQGLLNSLARGMAAPAFWVRSRG